MLTSPVSLLVTTRSSPPLPGGIDRLDVGDAQADGQGDRRQEVGGSKRARGADALSIRLPKKTREGAVAGIADDQVGQAVAVEVGRDDLRRELAGGERADQPDEAAVALGVERDGVVLGVDAGEHAGLDRCWAPRRCRARG